MTDLSHVRAVRNNNPGNIRVGAHWQGLMDRAHMNADQAAETDFCVFENPVAGFRAMATIFHTYNTKDGIKTLRGAISRWAPPTENNTGAYLNDVCNACQHGPDDPYPFNVPAAMQTLCHAVSIHEVGGWFFTTADLAVGVNSSH